MQSAEDQVARFSGGDGRVHRFQIAQFADQNHVRVLAQRPAQRFGEVGHIDVHLALRDHRLLMLVKIFDGVFDSDDVRVVALFVDNVNHRSQRRGLA